MKSVVSVAFFIVLFNILAAQTDYPQPQQIAGDLYEVALDGCNSVFLVTDSGVVVVDAGISPIDGHNLKESISSVTDKPVKYILLTHHHFDHVGGVQVFLPGARVIAASGLNNNMQNSGKKLFDDFIAEMDSAIENYKAKTAAEINRYIENGETNKADSIQSNISYFRSYIDSCKAVRIFRPDVEFEKSYTLNFGRQKIVLTHPGPAHTGSDCIVYFPDYHVVHLGDLYLEKTFPLIDKPAGASIDSWIKILKKLAGNNKYQKLICGHGTINDRSDLLIMRQLLVDINDAIRTTPFSMTIPRVEAIYMKIAEKYPDYYAPDILEKDIRMLLDGGVTAAFH